MDGVDNGRPPDSAPPVKSVVSFNNHVSLAGDDEQESIYTPSFNISSSY